MIRRNFGKLLMIASLLLAGQLLQGEDFVIVKDGVPQVDVIYPAKANIIEMRAAEELAYHLTKATGGKIPLTPENQFNPRNRKFHIFVGNTRAIGDAEIFMDGLRAEDYLLKTVDRSLFIRGVDREGGNWLSQWTPPWNGTLYGVYDLLETEFGVRWLWPGELGEHIPPIRNFSLPPLDRTGGPQFTYRVFVQEIQHKRWLCGWNDPETRERYLEEETRFLLRHRHGQKLRRSWTHAFLDYWKRFGKTHPEFFSLLPDGQRRPLTGDKDGSLITMCVSQPGLWKQIAADYFASPRRQFGNAPYEAQVNLCENDTPGMCTCETCRSWDAPDPNFDTFPYWKKDSTFPLQRTGRFRIARAAWGEDGGDSESEPPSLSDRYARFFNETIREVRKTDPEATGVSYAYANYYLPPVNVRLDPGIDIVYVPPHYFPYTKEDSDSFRTNWEGWKNAGARQLNFRPNYTLAGGNFPLLYGRPIAEDYAWASDRNMNGSCFDALMGSWPVQGPMLYTVAGLPHHPKKTAKEFEQEYYSAFAPAAKEVEAYFEYWQKFSDGISGEQFRQWGKMNPNGRGTAGGGNQTFVLVVAEMYPEKVFEESGKLLDAAEKAAKGNSLGEKRVAFLRAGWKDAFLTRTCRAKQKQSLADPGNSALRLEYLEAFRAVRDFRTEAQKSFLWNFGYHAENEKNAAGWPHPVTDLEKKSK